MEFRKSIINDNRLIRRDDHLPYSVKKNKNFDREIKNGGSLKTMNFKNFSNFKSGFAALFKKTAMKFRKTIINYNELTRIYAHLVYSVKKIKILIVKSKMATVLKLSIFDFCDFWIATSDLETCMHGSNFFTLPGPVRSAAKCAAVLYVIGLESRQ